MYIVLQRLSSIEAMANNTRNSQDDIFSFRVVNAITFIVKFIENYFQIKISQFILRFANDTIYKH